MDICMRLKPDEIPEGFDPGSEIVKVSKVLDRSPLYQKVSFYILTLRNKFFRTRIILMKPSPFVRVTKVLILPFIKFL